MNKMAKRVIAKYLQRMVAKKKSLEKVRKKIVSKIKTLGADFKLDFRRNLHVHRINPFANDPNDLEYIYYKEGEVGVIFVDGTASGVKMRLTGDYEYERAALRHALKLVRQSIEVLDEKIHQEKLDRVSLRRVKEEWEEALF